MNMRELASELAEAEGLKVEVSVGNMREILGLLSDLIYAEGGDDLVNLLYRNGKRRAKKKGRK